MEDVKVKTKKDTGLSMKDLREKKYVARPIQRKGGWVPAEHDSAFINDGAKKGFVVPVIEGNVMKNPFRRIRKDPNDPLIGKVFFDFNKEEIESLADELGIEIQKMNANVKKNYWTNRNIFLDKNGKHLDLKDSNDFINFLILASDEENIALGWGNRFEKGTYLFALCEASEELVDKVSNLEEKMKAYNYLDKIKGSAEKMKDFLYVYYVTKKDARKPPATANVDWLKGEIGRIIEDDMKIYLDIISDKDYNIKLLIQKSVEVGALQRNKHNYSLPGADRPIGVLEDVIEYLDNPKNQDVRMKLMHQVEDK